MIPNKSFIYGVSPPGFISLLLLYLTLTNWRELPGQQIQSHQGHLYIRVIGIESAAFTTSGKATV